MWVREREPVISSCLLPFVVTDATEMFAHLTGATFMFKMKKMYFIN